jgi:glutamate 5-kinase
MNELLRKEITLGAETIVVKVGTRVVTGANGHLDDVRIAQLAEQLNELVSQDRRVVLVSSGAVGAGMDQLGLSERPRDLAQLQAVAAVGQAKLIETYDRTFRVHGRHAAQVLLTAQDLDDRASYLNVRNTLLSLLEFKTIPIINENDTVAVEELMTTFGDNDRLAALVTNLLGAQLLVMLSDIDGLYDGDPQDESTSRISIVKELDDEIRGYAAGAQHESGKGGMISKLNASEIVTSAGENVIIASGHQDNVLGRIFQGDDVGTLFVAQDKSLNSRMRWLKYSAQPRGRLQVDEGALRAIRDDGSSLLPIGITHVEGDFDKGGVVEVCDPEGNAFARGLSNYNAEAVSRIQGVQSDQILEILGHQPYEEVIHRDNMTLAEADSRRRIEEQESGESRK